MAYPHVLVTIGDPSGIGPEITVKALRRLAATRLPARLSVIGDSSVLRRNGWRSFKGIALFDLKNVPKSVKPGKPSDVSARAGVEYLSCAVDILRASQADALVTAPISKEFARRGGFCWPGHTEYLAQAFGVRDVEMVFLSEKMRVVLVSRHMSLKEAITSLTSQRIVDCGRQMVRMLSSYARLSSPRIVVCGLNPHAGEGGLFGREEIRIIKPAVDRLNKSFGRKIFLGPLAPDAVFRQACCGGCDLVVAIYHDQGLIPFKMTEFSRGVHLTWGLPFVRTSPVHGTAYDIAGRKVADSGSMLEAIRAAIRFAGRVQR